MISLNKFFRFRTLGMKIIMFSLSVLIITGAVFMVLYYLNTNDALMKEKRAQTRTLVNSIMGIFDELNQEVKNGQLTLENAQQTAKGYLDVIRYDGDNYFFVIDTDVKMVFHPISKELNGTSVKNNQDPNGVYLFREMVQVAKAEESGFVDYYWPKAGSKQDEPKVSYIMLFEPWEWILGTGIYVDDVRATLMSTSMIMIIAIVVIIGISVFLALLFGKSISKRVGHLKQQIAQFAEKNLNIKFEEKGTDEIMDMGVTLNMMSRSLETNMRDIKEMSQKIHDSANQLAAVVEEQVAGSEEIASEVSQISSNFQDLSASTQEVNAGVEEISSGAQNAARVSQELTQNAQSTDDYAKEGQKSLKKVGDLMENASNQTIATAVKVDQLVSKAENVQKIIETISSIADQTNLLALNAAIEAARAGEAGKGFAVVADEIRKLAEESQNSASDINTILKEINQNAHDTQKSTDETKRSINEVNQMLKSTLEQFEGIISQVSVISGNVQNLASSVEEQSASSEEIASSMDTSAKNITNASEQLEHIDEATKEQSRAAEENGKTAEELSSMAERLAEFVNQFKFSD